MFPIQKNLILTKILLLRKICINLHKLILKKMFKEKRIPGKVKFYDQGKGYGFIIQPDGTDVFFHASKFINCKELKTDDLVEYSIGAGKNGKGAAAIDIELV